ncbi:isochorismatase family protein [Estrella lausannensis]|uniref:Putative isochorismatase hydrolase n=1 Tax=Estrella lausannensis TaxID=483423 RepID=A0A0H5DNU3_9BACT|nr:isochorismatase family protein [Estrella lausannensis]CRX37977.1 putative isochorismatase hydrolase [Estrella lausannensis]
MNASFRNRFVERGKTGFLLVDVQDKLFPLVENPVEASEAMIKAIKGFKLLGLPYIVSEQYPEKLGGTIAELKGLIDQERVFSKTFFSCLKDDKLKEALLKESVDTWILLGIEAHVCILQTAKDLILHGKQCVVLNDAISSRSVYDYSSAIAELRDIGARVSSVETILFELLQNSKAPEFKSVSQLIK